jgi:hypothetical protein
MRHCTTLLFLAGCGFSSAAGAPDAQVAPIDAPAADGSTPGLDAAVCVAGVVDVCGMPAPMTAFDVSSATTLDTGRDPRCKTVTVAGHDLCLIYATEVTITATGSLTVTGPRPLALVSASTMGVAGAIDAGSHGAQLGPAADDASCGFATSPDNDAGGAGGGAGGSFTLAGGNGGTGDTDRSIGGSTGAGGTHGATVPAPVLRGGCRGQKGGDEQNGFVGGNGGHGGGAVYLAARQSVSVPGSIRAAGAGGAGGQSQSGGGGGGSGGMVVIESASITISGQISANGGGGGQGGGRTVTGDNVTGFAGSDGALTMTPAPGGFGANNNDQAFSRGGVGGSGTTAAGPGTDSIIGGGGGGGAAGVVRLLGTTKLTGSMISPLPS